MKPELQPLCGNGGYQKRGQQFPADPISEHKTKRQAYGKKEHGLDDDHTVQLSVRCTNDMQ